MNGAQTLYARESPRSENPDHRPKGEDLSLGAPIRAPGVGSKKQPQIFDSVRRGGLRSRLQSNYDANFQDATLVGSLRSMGETRAFAKLHFAAAWPRGVTG